MAAMHSLFPLMLPLDVYQLKYDGFIQVKDKEFRLRIEIPKDKSLKNLRLYGDWQLVHHLRGYEDLVKTRLQSVPDVTTFMIELQNILQSTIDSSKTPEAIIETLDTSVFPRLFKFHFTSTDSGKREHTLQVNISSKTSLKQLLQQFEEFIEQFNDLWFQLEEFDQRTVVIEPENPRKSDLSRRVFLGNHTSIQMTLDPSHPRMCPDCRFLGADHVVTPLRKLNAALSNWDMTATVLNNIERVLNIKFPEPSSQTKQDLSDECGICYTYRLDIGIPDAVCDNTQCSRPYHKSCLYEVCM
ncbi:putative E3 ubiquitin-protein ligase FANCL-like [Apostichopus japonicus]|uniref:Putative E3 ubiquitin-protein ligase FANCL-like n=1 Tax=Stichopus japonicus TaxID=307972 RepID=A0A2G8LIW5_STIJA|nr:putative E3 ubiquitin-protein ligase FANCL-like [Apostichopus japonicus]